MDYFVDCTWKYYNHALLPDCKPHETPSTPPKIVGGKNIFFARWTSNWDCNEDTGWWWCIKDTPFDMNLLKSKKRYEIKKGIAHFDVRIIAPEEYVDELYAINKETLESYAKSYRVIPDRNSFVRLIPSWSTTFGAFDRNTGQLCGYILMGHQRDEVLYFSSMCVLQSCEKMYINVALVYSMLEHYNDKLCNGYYIVDGETNINHVTNFQNWLCDKFQFRKVNVKLNIIYNPLVGGIVKIIYPIRSAIYKFGLDNKWLHKISGVLKMEEIRRRTL